MSPHNARDCVDEYRRERDSRVLKRSLVTGYRRHVKDVHIVLLDIPGWSDCEVAWSSAGLYRCYKIQKMNRRQIMHIILCTRISTSSAIRCNVLTKSEERKYSKIFGRRARKRPLQKDSPPLRRRL